MLAKFIEFSVFPPARLHPRSTELVKLSNDYFLGLWTFKTPPHREHFLRSDLATFGTKCVPDGRFDKMIWACRVFTLFFLVDDMLDTDVLTNSAAKYDMIPEILSVISGTKKPGPKNDIEIINNDIWRGIQAGCSPSEFSQLLRLTKEFFGAHNLPACQNFEQWVNYRRVNSGAYFVFAVARYALECQLTDDEINHPLIKECEDTVAVVCSYVNDVASFAKESLTGSAETNVITMLQQHGISDSEEAAIARVREMIVEKASQLPDSCQKVLSDPHFVGNNRVERWLAALPYIMSGNSWWSQSCGRYNLPGRPAPRMAINVLGEGITMEPDPFPNTELKGMVENVPIPIRRSSFQSA